ncbi:MAG: hypothetical protein K2K42_03105 [Eubacterium sp.]|nr:hypothetical protein [Eubacterium sp.]
MQNRINMPNLVAGKLPSEKDECVVDARVFDESVIGKTITLSDENPEDIF